MVLKGQAKTDYQREYMRQRRLTVRPVVRPVVRPIVQPEPPVQADSAEVYSTGIRGHDADGNPIYED